jgi:hypothetical protein
VDFDSAVGEQSTDGFEVGVAAVDPYLRRHGWIATRSGTGQHVQNRLFAARTAIERVSE